jgi:CO/xanthine dehydrogenase Mo-binding subunit
MVGTGVAASTYPAYRSPAAATAGVDRAGVYTVLVNAIDIGTGTRTAMTQIAADALGVPNRSTSKSATATCHRRLWPVARRVPLHGERQSSMPVVIYEASSNGETW